MGSKVFWLLFVQGEEMKFEPMEFSQFVGLFKKASEPEFRVIGKGVVEVDGVSQNFHIFHHIQLGNTFVSFTPEKMIFGTELEIKRKDGLTTIIMRGPFGSFDEQKSTKGMVSIGTMVYDFNGGKEFFISTMATYEEQVGGWVLTHST